MQCIVIGANGFIGRAITAKLRSRGHKVDCYGYSQGHKHPPDIDHLSYTELDIRDRSAVLSAVTGAELLFHMGGVLGTHELNDMCHDAAMSNIVATINILDACVANNIQRVVYPAKPNIWFNTYTITKRASLDFMMLYKRRFSLDVRAVMLRNAYGPGQSTGPIRKIIPHMMTQVTLGKPIEIYGAGYQPVDLIHINDLAEALVTAGVNDALKTANWPIDTGRVVRMSVNDLATKIQDVVGRKIDIRHIPMREGEVESEWLGPQTEQTVFGLAGLSQDPYPVNTGLLESFDYYSAKVKAQAIAG